MSLSPLQQYQQALENGFVKDAAQLEAAQALQRCFDAVEQQVPTLGVYLWGPVGRGKTWLMDAFYRSLTVPAKRQHFHHFISWLHKRLFQLTGTENPLQVIADELAGEIKVLCFDELFVSDIGDAMLLGPLFQALFNSGVVLVSTSNQAPQDLYSNGFNRERFLPAIDALIAYNQVINLDGGQDHRLHGEHSRERYFVKTAQSTQTLENLFQQLSNAPAQRAEVTLGSRVLPAVAATNKVLWCDFSVLCEGMFGAQDYMQLCQQFEHIILSNIPNLSASQQEAKIARGTEDAPVRVVAGDRDLPALAKNDDAVRRFIALVDECYDQGIPLYIEAEAPLEALYTEGSLLFPFQRTRSRLEAMQRAFP